MPFVISKYNPFDSFGWLGQGERLVAIVLLRLQPLQNADTTPKLGQQTNLVKLGDRSDNELVQIVFGDRSLGLVFSYVYINRLWVFWRPRSRVGNSIGDIIQSWIMSVLFGGNTRPMSRPLSFERRRVYF